MAASIVEILAQYSRLVISWPISDWMMASMSLNLLTWSPSGLKLPRWVASIRQPALAGVTTGLEYTR